MANELTTTKDQTQAVTQQQPDDPRYRALTDIYEQDHAYVLEIEMPGVDDKNVDVGIEEGTLRVLGRRHESAREGYRPVYTEFGAGNYERSFRLSDDVDPEKVDAVLRDGVLTLTLHKREAAKPKRIAVKAG